MNWVTEAVFDVSLAALIFTGPAHCAGNQRAKGENQTINQGLTAPSAAEPWKT